MKRYIKSATEEKAFTEEERIRLFGEDPQGKVVIPRGYTSISWYAFDDCSSLTSITIPNSVTSIGKYAFRGCSSLTSIAVDSGNTVYDSRNNCNAIIETATNTLIAGCQNTVIPDSVTSIGDSAFRRCSSLTRITIPNSSNYAFYGCSGLTEITIPDSVTSIGRSAFSSCTGLTRITIPDSVISIGEYAFSWCRSLTKIAIPHSVTSIGNSAFYNCSNLREINFEGDLDSIKLGEDVFDSTPLEDKFDYIKDEEDHEEKEYSLDTWEDVKNALELDFELYNDPLYEQTAAGSYIDSLCQDVESDYGVGLEPSIQGGRGGIVVYTAGDDKCIASGIDYQDFNDSVLDIAMDSDSEEEFKSSYKVYLENVIEQHPCEDEDDEDY